MALDNRSIWLAGAFDNKRTRLNIICGTSEFRWKKLSTRVESILEDRASLFVVIAAGGEDPTTPSACDMTNAQLATTIVAMQWKYSISRKQFRAILKYPTNVQVEVDIDLAGTKKQIRTYLASARQDESNATLPTPVLSYFLTRSA